MAGANRVPDFLARTAISIAGLRVHEADFARFHRDETKKRTGERWRVGEPAQNGGLSVISR